MGRAVDIPLPVERAVFFQTYELIPVLDIWNKVVGIGRYAYDNDLMKATCPKIENIPSAGSGGDINMETVLKLQPDLVITWTWKPEAVHFMENKGLKVIAIYPDSLDELYDVMRIHGTIFNKEAKIQKAISGMEKIFSLIRERAQRVPPEKKRNVLWLGGKMNSVACGEGVTQDMFRMIGGINPAGTIPQRNIDVSTEQIVIWNPDVIFVWGNAGYAPQDVRNQAQMRYVRAVKEGSIYKAPLWSTWSPRLAPVALWMASKIYPEYYGDIDIDKLTDAFFLEVYGIPYAKVKKIEN
jgi:iron complex transport system substrate-binding protein